MTHTMIQEMTTPEGHTFTEIKNNNPKALKSVWIGHGNKVQVSVFRDGHVATVDYRPNIHMNDFIRHHKDLDAAHAYIDSIL